MLRSIVPITLMQLSDFTDVSRSHPHFNLTRVGSVSYSKVRYDHNEGLRKSLGHPPVYVGSCPSCDLLFSLLQDTLHTYVVSSWFFHNVTIVT